MKKSNRLYLISILCFLFICTFIVLFLHLFTYTDSSNIENSSLALSNHYSILTGVYAVCLLLVSGLFFLRLAFSKQSWTLLLIMFSYATLMLYTITAQSGEYFLPKLLYRIISWKWFVYLPSHSVLLFLLLKQDKYYFKCTVHVLRILLFLQFIWYVTSQAFHGYYHQMINSFFIELFEYGKVSGLLHWITLIVLFSTTGASIITTLRQLIQLQIKKQIDEYYRDTYLNHYDTLQSHIDEIEAQYTQIQDNWNLLQHYIDQSEYSKIKPLADTITQLFSELPQSKFCNNHDLNSLLMIYEREAKRDQISIDFQIDIPNEFPSFQGDIRFFITNLLNNAMDASRLISDPKHRHISFELQYENGYLSICCENNYYNSLLYDEYGDLLSSKKRYLQQGFGLNQMSIIAEKYGSSLAIHHNNNTFLLQTKLRLV